MLFLFLETGALGVFAAQNLLWFFIFLEITLVATFLMISIWGGVEREKAALKYLLYNGIGSAVILLALCDAVRAGVHAEYRGIDDAVAGPDVAV